MILFDGTKIHAPGLNVRGRKRRGRDPAWPCRRRRCRRSAAAEAATSCARKPVRCFEPGRPTPPVPIRNPRQSGIRLPQGVWAAPNRNHEQKRETAWRTGFPDLVCRVILDGHRARGEYASLWTIQEGCRSGCPFSEDVRIGSKREDAPDLNVSGPCGRCLARRQRLPLA